MYQTGFDCKRANYSTGFIKGGFPTYYASSEKIEVVDYPDRENPGAVQLYGTKYLTEHGDSGSPVILCDKPKCGNEESVNSNQIKCKLAGVAAKGSRGQVVFSFTPFTAKGSTWLTRDGGMRFFNIIASLFEADSAAIDVIIQEFDRGLWLPPGDYLSSCDRNSISYYAGMLRGNCKNKSGIYVTNRLNYWWFCYRNGKSVVHNLNGELSCDWI